MSAENRRPIKARSLSLIASFASWLARTKVTPNQISVFSVVFSLFVPIAFWAFESGSWMASMLALMGIQFRLMCNLLDGMVAIEGAKKSVLGDIYNEFPDRISDSVILIGLALVDQGDPTLLCIAIGAALLAVMTAYTRVLGAAVGTRHFFSGPMAKQHRMAILSIVVIASPLMKSIVEPQLAIKVSLAIICVGCVITVFRRLQQIAGALAELKQTPA